MFDARRMVDEYDRVLYSPAHAGFIESRKNGFQKAREHTAWARRIRQIWSSVRFVDTGADPAEPLTSGKTLPVQAKVELAGLEPADVRVEVVWGEVGANGKLENTETGLLEPGEQHGTIIAYAKDLLPRQTGRLGYALRISPNHFQDPMTRSAPSLIKWGA